jgi:hypothetical protein
LEKIEELEKKKSRRNATRAKRGPNMRPDFLAM